MSEDYLWDRSGKPDPEIQRIESLLGRYRYRGAESKGRVHRFRMLVAAAAAFLLLATGLYLALREGGPSYEVVYLEGAARITSGKESPPSNRARAGDIIQTDGSTQAELTIGSAGKVRLLENSRVELVDCGEKNHRLNLARGSLRARIYAEPRLFQIGTPAAIAVDLGCIYKLTVDKSDITTLTVETGRVSLEINDRMVSVPGGAVCRADPVKGLGIPFREKSSKALKNAVIALENDREKAPALLPTCLEAATNADTITLWHLFEFLEDEKDRGVVYDRLAMLSPPPAGVTREACVGLDREALDAWKQEQDW
ncbi:MAG: FecR domain-containing protein [Planctomycetota bacterium]|nr:FecR domain-containing protein [Planctomycetota bacterium]